MDFLTRARPGRGYLEKCYVSTLKRVMYQMWHVVNSQGFYFQNLIIEHQGCALCSVEYFQSPGLRKLPHRN